MDRQTKIICTLGPATDSVDAIRALIAAGMDAARLNFSHGALEEHARRIENIRQASIDLDRPIAILADLPGPKIRIGDIEGEPVVLQRSASFSLTRREVPGDAREVHLPAPEVFRAVRPGNALFLDDGLIELRVEAVSDDEIRTEVMSGGRLSSHKGLALPGINLDMPGITEEDRDVLGFIAGREIDWVAVSFVRSADDLRTVRRILADQNASLPLIAKIEQHEAVDHLAEIIEEADGLMVARGDLGVEKPIFQVPILQKQIIARCNRVGKPVITATQMLDSMIRNPRPTRAEVTDVANAVLDGTDCVMLSGETAIGRYPNETVRLMQRICLEAERSMEGRAFKPPDMGPHVDTVTDAISQATCDIASRLDVRLILTSTSSGQTARMVSRHRPPTPIIGLTPDPSTYRRLALTWGVHPILTPRAYDTDETLEIAVRTVQDRGLVNEGDLVIITAGVPTGVPGYTNLLKVHRVGSQMADDPRIAKFPVAEGWPG